MGQIAARDGRKCPRVGAELGLRRKALEHLYHLLVRDLSEVPIKQSNCPKERVILKTHDVVGLLAHCGNAIGWPDGHGEHEPFWISHACCAQGGPHRRSGSDAVIDYNRRTTGDIDSFAPAQILPPPPFDLGEFPIADGLELRLANAGVLNHVFVSHNERDIAIDDGAHGEFGLKGYADLAHQDEIERRIESARNLSRHGNAAARQCKDGRLLIPVPRERLRQFLTGFKSVIERHYDLPCFSPFAAEVDPAEPGSRYRSNHRAAWSITASSAPGSGKRWLALGTISRAFRPGSRNNACSLSSMTPTSALPTMRRVGVQTRSRESPARSGRPPRETTAPTRCGRFAAATSAAAAPAGAKQPKRKPREKCLPVDPIHRVDEAGCQQWNVEHITPIGLFSRREEVE